MRLSEAILLGRVTIIDPAPCDITRCALGMAANAVGVERTTNAVIGRWPWLLKLSDSRCPVMGSCYTGQVFYSVLVHIFDSHVILGHDWTLEQLVDWVCSVEPDELEVGETQNEQTDGRQVPIPKLCFEATEAQNMR